MQYRTVWANCKRNRCTLHTTDGSIQARPTKAFVPQSGGVHVRLAGKSDKFLPTSARSKTNNNECFKIRVGTLKRIHFFLFGPTASQLTGPEGQSGVPPPKEVLSCGANAVGQE